jgi:hypothetical protein
MNDTTNHMTLNRGRGLVELAKELQRIHESKRDFVVPTRALWAVSSGATQETPAQIELRIPDPKDAGHLVYKPNGWANQQLAEYTGIPKVYYDRLRGENPYLLADNINHGLRRLEQEKAKGKPESRMVRTVDGSVRALLSPSYRVVDSYDVLNETLPMIVDHRMDIVSADLTEKRVYVKAVLPTLRGEVKKGDEVMYGLILSSSDVGAGAVQVNPFLFRQVCSNGMIMTFAFRKFHVGKSQAEENIRELLSDETRALDDAAFFAKIRDVVKASLDPKVFDGQLEKLREAAGLEIEAKDPEKVVELAMKATGVGGGEGVRKSILAALATGNEGAGYTKWGLANAFTRAANDAGIGYETSTELQKAGGDVIELSRADWKRIGGAA